MKNASEDPTDDLFDLGRPAFDETVVYEVVPRAAGGWEAVTVALVRLLERCTETGLWWATIDQGDDGATSAFAHLGPDEGGAIWAEVSADFHLPEEDRLTDEQEASLVGRGWSTPLDEEGMQNFHRSFGGGQLGPACAEVLATLRDVYGFEEADVLRVIVEPFEVTPA